MFQIFTTAKNFTLIFKQHDTDVLYESVQNVYINEKAWFLMTALMRIAIFLVEMQIKAKTWMTSFFSKLYV